jgi:hypothetical protein
MENARGSLIHDGGLIGLWFVVQCMIHFLVCLGDRVAGVVTWLIFGNGAYEGMYGCCSVLPFSLE